MKTYLLTYHNGNQEIVEADYVSFVFGHYIFGLSNIGIIVGVSGDLVATCRDVSLSIPEGMEIPS